MLKSGAECHETVTGRIFESHSQPDFHRLFHRSVEKSREVGLPACPLEFTISLGMLRRAFFFFPVLLVAQHSKTDQQLAPYYPTPEAIVMKMLQMGGLKAGEKVYDLGSGDGRIVIMAAQRFHADAFGVELDKDLCKLSTAKIVKLGLEKNAHIINGDLLTQNYSSADLVTVYLLPDSINNKVQPLLDSQLKPGARVVAHDFEFRNWKPEKVETIADDGEGRSHTLYLYKK